jgi:branched-chain amino acid transport system substrate-binding protein
LHKGTIIKKFIGLFFLISIVFRLFAQDINIGVILPLSGALSNFGKNAKEALSVINEQKSTLSNGDEIKLIYTNNRSDKAEAASLAKKLVQKDKVVAVIGAVTSSSTLAIESIMQNSATSLIVPAATNKKVANGKKFITKVCINDSFEGVLLAKYLLNKGYKRAVVIGDNRSDYSKDLSATFKKSFTTNGAKVVKNISIDPNNITINTDELKEINPDIIVFTNFYTQAAPIVKKIRSAQIQTQLIGADAIGYKEFIDSAKEDAEGFIFLDQFSENALNSAEAKSYLNLYKQKYHNKTLDTTGALFVDSYNLIVKAMNMCIEKSSSANDKKCIQKNLSKISEFSGLTGVISFNKNGNAVKSAVIKEVIGGKFIFKSVIYP